MAKRKKDGLKQATIGLVGGSVILSTGSSVVQKTGGSAAGLTAAAGFMPAMGTAMGAGMTLMQLKKLERLKRR